MLARARARFSCAYTKCVNDGDYMVIGRGILGGVTMFLFQLCGKYIRTQTQETINKLHLTTLCNSSDHFVEDGIAAPLLQMQRRFTTSMNLFTTHRTLNVVFHNYAH